MGWENLLGSCFQLYSLKIRLQKGKFSWRQFEPEHTCWSVVVRLTRHIKVCIKQHMALFKAWIHVTDFAYQYCSFFWKKKEKENALIKKASGSCMFLRINIVQLKARLETLPIIRAIGRLKVAGMSLNTYSLIKLG